MTDIMNDEPDKPDFNSISRSLALVFSGIFTIAGCGGGGGGSGGGVNAPVISNLRLLPDASYLNNGGGTVFVNASVDFSDADGDLSSFSLDIYDSSNVRIDSLRGPTTGAGGVTSGTVFASVAVSTTVADNYSFTLTMSDARGNQSNQLIGIFPIEGPIQTISQLPDTGVNRCYNQSAAIDCPVAGNAFYGQDFQYTSNSMSFNDNGDGTVTDNVTSLMWQQAGPPWHTTGFRQAAHLMPQTIPDR